MSKAKRKNSSYKTEPKKPVINSRSDRIRYANQKLYDYPCLSLGFAYSRP